MFVSFWSSFSECVASTALGFSFVLFKLTLLLQSPLSFSKMILCGFLVFCVSVFLLRVFSCFNFFSWL